MPIRYLSDPELARLSSWPDEIAAEDAVTYFTLSTDDLSWRAGSNRQQNRLGVAMELTALPWPGWIPDDLTGCPAAALGRLAAFWRWTRRRKRNCLPGTASWQGRTRREYRAQVMARRGWS